jgi:Rrf2 family protein
MSINSRFTVTVHILALLALEQKPLSSKYIAASVNTNPVVIRRILGLLSRAGLVTTQLGVDGGSALARPPEQITLLQLYHLVEHGHLFSLHPNQPNTHCPCGRTIQPVLTGLFQKAEAAMAAVLGETTLADVVQDIRVRLSDQRP